MTGLMMKFFKIITLIILILQSSITFAAVSGFVDSKQVTQNLPMAVAFNPSGTKMFVVGMSQNKILEFDLTTGFDVSTASKNSNECSFIGLADDAVDIDFNSNEAVLSLESLPEIQYRLIKNTVGRLNVEIISENVASNENLISGEIKIGFYNE